MTIIVLNLPIPPSVNEIYRNVPRVGRVKSTSYKQWIKAALSELWTQKPAGGFPFFGGPFACSVALPLAMRGDCDNRLKGALDFLKTPAGIIADDSKAFETRAFRCATVAKDMCRVTISDVPPISQEAA